MPLLAEPYPSDHFAEAAARARAEPEQAADRVFEGLLADEAARTWGPDDAPAEGDNLQTFNAPRAWRMAAAAPVVGGADVDNLLRYEAADTELGAWDAEAAVAAGGERLRSRQGAAAAAAAAGESLDDDADNLEELAGGSQYAALAAAAEAERDSDAANAERLRSWQRSAAAAAAVQAERRAAAAGAEDTDAANAQRLRSWQRSAAAAAAVGAENAAARSDADWFSHPLGDFLPDADDAAFAEQLDDLRWFRLREGGEPADEYADEDADEDEDAEDDVDSSLQWWRGPGEGAQLAAGGAGDVVQFRQPWSQDTMDSLAALYRRQDPGTLQHSSQ